MGANRRCIGRESHLSLSTSIEGESLNYRTWNVRVAPELPSRIVIMKNWHRTCFWPVVSFFCSTPQSHSSVPTCALAVPSRAAVVKDGRRLRRPPHQRREASLTTASTAAHLACRAATSHFRFPCSLRDEGSGSGKPIKCDDNEPIKVRDPA